MPSDGDDLGQGPFTAAGDVDASRAKLAPLQPSIEVPGLGSLRRYGFGSFISAPGLAAFAQ